MVETFHIRENSKSSDKFASYLLSLSTYPPSLLLPGRVAWNAFCRYRREQRSWCQTLTILQYFFSDQRFKNDLLLHLHMTCCFICIQHIRVSSAKHVDLERLLHQSSFWNWSINSKWANIFRDRSGSKLQQLSTFPRRRFESRDSIETLAIISATFRFIIFSCSVPQTDRSMTTVQQPWARLPWFWVKFFFNCFWKWIQRVI